MKFLSPEKQKYLLQIYHKSNYLLLPFGFGSFFINDSPFEGIKSLVQTGTVLTYGYHSYVSTSFILSDYIKFKKISFPLRLLNSNLHFFATIGFLKMIFFPFSKKINK